MSSNEAAPLLGRPSGAGNQDDAAKRSRNQRARAKARAGLDSKLCHYSIVFLVVLDLVIIFAEFLLQLFRCEHQCVARGGGKHGGKVDENSDAAMIQEALGTVSLIFSCVFMVELVVSVWAFGGDFFRSAFRVFDGVIIVAGFTVDVGLQGAIEEVGSIVIVLRLWRVFKIIGELSAQAAEQVGDLNEKIARLREENTELKGTIDVLRKDTSDGSTAR